MAIGETVYTLRAYFTYDDVYVVLDPVLTDTLANLFLVVCGYKFVVLEDEGMFIPTTVIKWWFNPPVNVVMGTPGEMRLPLPIARFATLEQAATYIDIIQK
jgi:hypothetical protein